METMRFEMDWGDGRVETTVVSDSGTETFPRRLRPAVDGKYNRGVVGECRRAIKEAENKRDRSGNG